MATGSQSAGSPGTVSALVDPSRLRPGDALVLDADSNPPMIPSHITIEGLVQEDGTVTFLSNRVFAAVGKTHGEFRQEVADYYVPKFFKRVTVTSTSPPFYLISGEVRSPGLKVLMHPITVLKAIDSAGGFTASAKRTKVKLIRGETQQILNCDKARQDPTLDKEVLRGDDIVISRSFWK